MIRNIAGRVVDMTNTEFEYYEELAKVFGENVFKNSFASDDGGRIIAVTPSTTEPTSMAIIFFLLNLMMNQRLRAIDSKLTKINALENRISELEKRLNNG